MLPEKRDIFSLAQRRKEDQVIPAGEYVDAERGILYPAILEPQNLRNSYLPRDLLKFNLLREGRHPFIIAAEDREESPEITSALFDLFANFNDADYWEKLFIQTSSRNAELFVIDRRNERYRVKEVEIDVGGETGVLVLQHLGKRGRGGKLIRIDIEEGANHMMPVVVYKPHTYNR